MQHKDLPEMEENAQVINLKLISVKTETSFTWLEYFIVQRALARTVVFDNCTCKYVNSTTNATAFYLQPRELCKEA